jgi:hypothetical protein
MIKNFQPKTYAGDFEVVSEGVTVTGRFNTNASKNITNANGEVETQEGRVCSFSAWDGEGELVYNIENVQNLSALGDAIPSISGAMQSVISDLTAR